MQQHRSIEKSTHAAQTMSTSSCSSSTEVDTILFFSALSKFVIILKADCAVSLCICYDFL